MTEGAGMDARRGEARAARARSLETVVRARLVVALLALPLGLLLNPAAPAGTAAVAGQAALAVCVLSLLFWLGAR
jgi:hypothetical protein